MKSLIDAYKIDEEGKSATIVTCNGDIMGGCLLFTLDKGASAVDVCN